MFWSPPETRAITKDPGNGRFRIRSDSRNIFIKKYLKTKKLELLQENRKTEKFVIKIAKIPKFQENINIFEQKF